MFPLDLTETFFLHDAHERFFDTVWMSINLVDILFSVDDSISVVVCANFCVKGGIFVKKLL